MTRKEKKQLTVILTVVVFIALIIILAVPYVRKLNEYNRIIEQRALRIQSLKRQITNKPLLTKEVTRVDELMNRSGLFIRAQNEQEATGKLLSTVKKIVEANGGEIKTVNPQTRRKGDKNSVKVRVTLFADHEQLVGMLNEMATAKPMLDISGIRLTALTRRGGRKIIENNQINVVVEIRSFYLLSPS